MNVTVFGATGAIGQLTVAALLDDGATVTAHARNPAKVPATWGRQVRVVIGEVTDASSIDDAVKGADVVISALGPSMDRKATGTPLVDGTDSILDSMNRHGVRRFVGHATPSIRDPRDTVTIQMRVIRFLGSRLLPRAYAELVGMCDLIRSSDLDWTLVRFTAPKDGPARGHLRVGFYGSTKIRFGVTRSDIAQFTASQLESRDFVRSAPAISN